MNLRALDQSFSLGLGAMSLSGGGGGASLASQFLAIPTLKAFYDDTDVTSLYTLRAGGTSVAVDGNPVGLQLDKAQMGGKSAAEFIAAQPNLWTNAPTQVDSPWTALGGGAWSINGSQVANKDMSLTPVFTTGGWYAVTYTLSAVSGSGNLYVFGGVSPASRIVAAAGTYTDIVRSTQVYMIFRAEPGLALTISNIQIKAIPGHHRIATNDAGARPTWKVVGGKGRLDTDGSDDAMSAPSLTGVFRNVGGGALVSAYRWKTSPATTKYSTYTSGGTGAVRASLMGGATANKHGVGVRRQDLDSSTNVASAADVSTVAHQVQYGELDWANGAARQYINGVLDGTSSPSAGDTENTAATGISFFATAGGANFGDVEETCTAFFAGSAPPSAGERAIINSYFSQLAGI